ncbi:MAG: hypothetical protein GY711_14770 [bacterium]|nr:hypothetical protein [bacterium]
MTAAARDLAGGVYLAGRTEGDLGGLHAGGSDAWLARFDGAGNPLWLRQLGTSSDDEALAATPDQLGGVYVAGRTEGSLGGSNAGFEDAWIAHYDSMGNQLWIRQLGTISNEEILGAAPNGSAGVFVSGATEGSLGGQGAGSRDAWVANYDVAGSQLWIRQLGTSSPDESTAVATDGAGGVYVSGATRGSLGGPWSGSFDAWIAHYDLDGNRRWIRQLGTSSSEVAFAAAPGGSGDVYVSGITFGSLGGPNAGSGDVWIARYSGDLGATYCTPATLNSTGSPAVIAATGSGAAIENDLTLIASQLPPGQFGYFLAGQTQGFVTPPASQGNLCLSGDIGRLDEPSQIIQGPSGSVQVDLTDIPVNPATAVQPGETWNFQCWYRDSNPGSTSNFTDAAAVTFS